MMYISLLKGSKSTLRGELVDGQWKEASADIAKLIERFLVSTETGWRDLAEDPACRGVGLCLEAAIELCDWLETQSIGSTLVYSHTPTSKGPMSRYSAKGGHYICLLSDSELGTWCIDLTARQFDDDLPFPSFFEVTP